MGYAKLDRFEIEKATKRTPAGTCTAYINIGRQKDALKVRGPVFLKLCAKVDRIIKRHNEQEKSK